MTPKRTHIVVTDVLDIDIYHDRNPPEIYIMNPDKVLGAGSMVEVPDDANYFHGTLEQFIDMLQRMKKKYGHLYK